MLSATGLLSAPRPLAPHPSLPALTLYLGSRQEFEREKEKLTAERDARTAAASAGATVVSSTTFSAQLLSGGGTAAHLLAGVCVCVCGNPNYSEKSAFL